jgi:hypothetical protein
MLVDGVVQSFSTVVDFVYYMYQLQKGELKSSGISMQLFISLFISIIFALSMKTLLFDAKHLGLLFSWWFDPLFTCPW